MLLNEGDPKEIQDATETEDQHPAASENLLNNELVNTFTNLPAMLNRNNM